VEIVVADDGSTDATAEVVRRHEERLEIVHVRQADRGFRLARTCNLGFRAARHDALVLLQSDMLPAPRLLASYAAVLAAADNALLIGHRRFTCSDHLTAADILADPQFADALPEIATSHDLWPSDSPYRREDWREDLYRQTDGLRAERFPFRAVVGSNLAFHRLLLQQIGGFNEQFSAWGGEDGEFAYRAYNAGWYFVPVPGAIAYHQEPAGCQNETDRRAGWETTKSLRQRLCALPPFRNPHHRNSFDVPKVSVCVHARNDRDIDACLARIGDFHDLETVVIVPPQGPRRLRRKQRLIEMSETATPAALNAAAAASRGAYILPMDWQTPLTPDSITVMVALLDETDAACVHAGGVCMYRKRDWSRAGGFRHASPAETALLWRELESVGDVLHSCTSPV
jgi:chondroitin synthase